MVKNNVLCFWFSFSLFISCNSLEMRIYVWQFDIFWLYSDRKPPLNKMTCIQWIQKTVQRTHNRKPFSHRYTVCMMLMSCGIRINVTRKLLLLVAKTLSNCVYPTNPFIHSTWAQRREGGGEVDMKSQRDGTINKQKHVREMQIKYYNILGPRCKMGGKGEKNLKSIIVNTSPYVSWKI